MAHFLHVIGVYGARKVEANALVVRPEAGRALCRQAILDYVSEDDLSDYHEQRSVERAAVGKVVAKLLRKRTR